jgi:hypothetical protein
MPVCAPPAFAPEIVTLCPFWLTVMLLPPARMSVPDETSAMTPAVLPDSDTSTQFCVWTVCVATAQPDRVRAATDRALGNGGDAVRPGDDPIDRRC